MRAAPSDRDPPRSRPLAVLPRAARPGLVRAAFRAAARRFDRGLCRQAQRGQERSRFSRPSYRRPAPAVSAAHLFCAGEGDERAPLQAALGPASTFAGLLTQDELARIYASADLFLFPSEIDEFGSAAQEALASGLPVLAARGSGFASSMANCPAVRVLPGDDPEPWAAVIADLAAAPHRRARDGAGGTRLCRGAGAELARGPRTGSAAGMAGGGESAEAGPAMNPVAGRVLILAPHPDDEVVACAHCRFSRDRGRRARFRAAFDDRGAPGARLWPWQRPGYPERVWRRQEEALGAARLLGLEIVGFRDTAARRLRFDLDAAASRHCRGDCPLRGGGDLGSGVRGRASGPRRRERAGGGGLRARCRSGNSRPTISPAGGSGPMASPMNAAARPRFRHRGRDRGRSGRRSPSTPRSAAICGISWRTAKPAGRCRRMITARRRMPGRLFRERFHWVPFRHPARRFRSFGRDLPGSRRLGCQPGGRAGRRRSATAQAASPGSPTANSRARLTRPSASAAVGRQSGDRGERDERRFLRAPAARDQEGGAARGKAEAFEHHRRGEPGRRAHQPQGQPQSRRHGRKTGDRCSDQRHGQRRAAAGDECRAPRRATAAQRRAGADATRSRPRCSGRQQPPPDQQFPAEAGAKAGTSTALMPPRPPARLGRRARPAARSRGA